MDPRPLTPDRGPKSTVLSRMAQSQSLPTIAPQPQTHISRLEARSAAVLQIYYVTGLKALDMCLFRLGDHAGQTTLFLNLWRPQIPRLAAPMRNTAQQEPLQFIREFIVKFV